MGIDLDPEQIIEIFGDDDPTQYADEARDRWGDTDAYRQSHARTSAYGPEEWRAAREEWEQVTAEFASCLASGEPATGERAAAAAESHRAQISRWYYDCSYDMQVGLAEMYVADPRFTATYDDRAPGLAQFVHDAIVANAINRA